MKKLLYTLLAVSIIFSACEKEESNSNSNLNINVSNMTGIWEATSFIINDGELANSNTIRYWLKADMTIEENIQNSSSNNINSNTGIWEINESNLIIEWFTAERTTYQITSLNNTSVSLLLVEWLEDEEVVDISISASFEKQ